MQTIQPSLWFNNTLEEAVEYYTGIFPDSKIGTMMRGPDGAAISCDFQLNGNSFQAINGAGVDFPFSEAVSFVVHCDSQEEVDYFWFALTANGGQESQCGWLKDKFGLSWQIVPVELMTMSTDPDPEKVGRVMQVMLTQKKLDLEPLRRAFNGE